MKSARAVPSSGKNPWAADVGNRGAVRYPPGGALCLAATAAR